MAKVNEALIRDRISKAKSTLVLDHTFFGILSMNMQVVISTEVPTAATDGRCVIYNPEFVAKLTDSELLFLEAHECSHPGLEHNWRRMGRHPRKWNIAGDIIINQHLVQDKIGVMPKGGLHNPKLYAQGNGTTEGVYNLLPDEPGHGIGNVGGAGNPMDECRDATDTAEGAATELAEEWKVRVAQAAQTARNMGKMSVSLEKLVTEMLCPRVRWQDVLARFVSKCKDDARTWARPNRRFVPYNMYVPSMTGEQLGEFVIFADCSGSVDDKQYAQLAAEIRAICVDTRPVKVHVVYFDAKVLHHDTYENGDLPVIKRRGGGGTMFSPMFKYITDQGIEPVGAVVLTDLECTDFGPAPDYPVLWMTTAATHAPWGEVVRM